VESHICQNRADTPNFLHAALDTTARAPFFKERRMKFAEPTTLPRKSGIWGTRHPLEISLPATLDNPGSVRRAARRRYSNPIHDAACRPVSLAIRAKKSEGDFSCETSPSLSDFRRSGSAPDHNVCRPKSLGAHEPKPATSSFLQNHSHCESFSLPSFSSYPDRVSLPILRDDRYSAFFFWKITLPLKAILLSARGNASGSCNLLLWK
jgi:hypothetical protein